MKKRIFGRNLLLAEAIATLVGTIIGAGILAIPYAMAKAGFLTGLLVMILLSFAVVFLYLFLGEITLKTKGKHQLVGYIEKYFGKGKKLITFSMIFGIYGALTAYIIGVGKSFAALFNLQTISIFGLVLEGNLFFSILFFLVGSCIVYLGLKAIEESELFLSSIVIMIIFIISIFAFFKIDIINLAAFDIKKIFVPYGVILFALAGAVAIPEMREELEKNEKLLKKAIIIGSLIPIFLYILFSLATIGVCGKQTSEIATICLGNKLGFFVFLFGNLFAIFAMSTSFLTLGLGLREMYNYDYKIKKGISCLLALLVPLIIFLIVFFFAIEESFFKTISITGGIAMTIEGILIILTHKKAREERKPEYKIKKSNALYFFLITIFVLGFFYTIFHFFGLV